jgi:hypothetical protein
MSPEQRVQRAKTIRILFLYLQKRLFEKEEENKLEAMGQLALQNSAIRNTGTSCFLFEGIWYTYPPGIKITSKSEGLDPILDISLREQAYNIIHNENFNSIELKAAITNFFGKALQTCPTIQCLNSVLPAGLRISSELAYCEINDGNPMTGEEIEQFKEDNKKGRAALNTLLLTDLIMAKVDT